MSTLSNIPKARYDWIVGTLRDMRAGLMAGEQGDRFNAIHALMTLGFARYSIVTSAISEARIYWLTDAGKAELERIEAHGRCTNEPT